MAQKNKCYKVEAVGSGTKISYPMGEVRPGTIVKAMESCPNYTVDVIDVKLKNGHIKNVYSFQLRKSTSCPKQLRR